MQCRAPLLLLLIVSITTVEPHRGAGIQQSDLTVLQEIRNSVTNSHLLSWPNATDPCLSPGWRGIRCNPAGRVSRIDIPSVGLEGGLPPSFSNLSFLQFVNLQENSLSGPLPSFRGMSSLQYAYLNDNAFYSISADFFNGLSNLVEISLENNPFHLSSGGGWTLPGDFASLVPKLKSLKLRRSYLVGSIPDFLFSMKSLQVIMLSNNLLSGPVPAATVNGSNIRMLWIEQNMLTGTIDFITTMTGLEDVSLANNQFTGPIPDGIGACKHLRRLCLNNNMLVGMVPPSLDTLLQLQYIDIESNSLLGPTPLLNSNITGFTVQLDLYKFCSRTQKHICSSEVMALLYFLADVHYPMKLANSWIGNDPCNAWLGINCIRGKVSMLSLPGYALNGTISQSLGNLTGLLEIRLEDNHLTGYVPDSLKNLRLLQKLDLSMNDLTAPLPTFSPKVFVNISGNANFTANVKAAGQKKKKSKFIKIIVPLVACMVILLICIAVLKYRAVVAVQRKKDLDLPFVSFRTILAATAHFSDSNVLGQGGFGKVYKGILGNGDEIAVKRLSDKSKQGTEEFLNEVNLIAKVQHRNLVRVTGYCIHKTALHKKETLIIYEYLPNKSLDFFIFDATRKSSLDWPTRFNIIKVIAKGLLYLHQDSSVKIIHRDLKVANILLDNKMNPKISDFGLARIFGQEQQQANTSRPAGTLSYMAPEYIRAGEFSEKSDIYSFGVILLEIISGCKTSHSDPINRAWELWQAGTAFQFVDTSVVPSCTRDESERYIQIGLLCTQEQPGDRPLMPSVLSMLENRSLVLPAPNRTVYNALENRSVVLPAPNRTVQSNDNSVNEASITVLEGR
ncbi:unnamed protein product [Alopecurus aequalis]